MTGKTSRPRAAVRNWRAREAIAVNPSGEEDEIPSPEGDYLIIGEDDTIQMFFETDDGMQQNDFSTEIRDGKVYLNGNVNVGEFRSDGSVILNINDEINYIYAKEGSAPWKEWQAYLAEKSGDTDAGDASPSFVQPDCHFAGRLDHEGIFTVPPEVTPEMERFCADVRTLEADGNDLPEM